MGESDCRVVQRRKGMGQKMAVAEFTDLENVGMVVYPKLGRYIEDKSSIPAGGSSSNSVLSKSSPSSWWLSCWSTLGLGMVRYPRWAWFCKGFG